MIALIGVVLAYQIQVATVIPPDGSGFIPDDIGQGTEQIEQEFSIDQDAIEEFFGYVKWFFENGDNLLGKLSPVATHIQVMITITMLWLTIWVVGNIANVMIKTAIWFIRWLPFL